MAGTPRSPFFMNPTQFQKPIPPPLREGIQAWAGRALERGTIVVKDDVSKGWTLLGCTLRPLQTDALPPPARFVYENVILVADCVPGSELTDLVIAPMTKLSQHVGEDLALQFWPGCERHPVPL